MDFNSTINELTLLIAADEAEVSTLDPAIDATRFARLTQRIATRQERVTALTTRNAELTGQLTDHQTRIAELTARNAELTARISDHETRITELTARNTELAVSRDAHDTRAAELTTRTADLAAQNTAHETRIEELETRNFKLAEQRAQLEADLEAAQAGCDKVAAEGLYYLHADHLGRPQFATDTSGSVVWDMGGEVTPFGDSVNLAGAFAQQLMFPGQYADLETGGEGDDVTLSHNWHRTYDPTLGRYLQSDPIGLAGGLNRYAYVGGNPVSYVDPTGELIFLAPLAPILVGIVAGFVADYILDQAEEKYCGCEPSFKDDAGTALGGLRGVFGPYGEKPRTGVAGGGISRTKTSVYSQQLSKLKNKGKLSVKNTKKLRNIGRVASKATGVLNVGYYGYRINKIRKCVY